MNKSLLADSLNNGYTYNNYRLKIKNLLREEKSSGLEQNEMLLNYSGLNDKRMDRLDKTLSLTEETVIKLNQIEEPISFLVISEGWCGDAAQIVPVLNKIAEASSKINLTIVFRDENAELMNLFLTNGSKSIPKLIMLDSENNVLGTWGPRPSKATQMVKDYKEIHGAIDAEFKKELQVWYNKDKGENIQTDLLKLMAEKTPLQIS